MKARGIDPGGVAPEAPLSGAQIERRRATSGLAPLVPCLRMHLLPAGEATGQLMVVTDAEGRVLWREGSVRILSHADGLGFVGGSAWTEGNVGTNAIGTCLVTQLPLQVHAAEHFAEAHTYWTCASAPLNDPLTGRVLGVVDLSGPAHTGHATTLALVTMAARLAELEVRAHHEQNLDELRAVAAPVLAKLAGRACAVAPSGLVAAVTGMAAPTMVSLPDSMTPGAVWLPGLGHVTCEPLPGGWLLRPRSAADGEGAVTSLTLDLSGRPRLVVESESGSWNRTLSPRHAEILLALLVHRDGRSAAELADDLFADPTRTVTVRAEMSRLRRTLGAVLFSSPYRIGPEVEANLVLPGPGQPVLPGSSAPVVSRLAS